MNDPQFQAAVTDALAPIEGDSRISKMITPYNAPNTMVAQAFTSKDGHEALVSVELKSSGQAAWKDYDALRASVRSSTLSVTGTGFVAINQSFNKTLESDLQRAEFVTLPATLILLILIFATIVAAGLPLGVGILTIVGGIGGTFFLNRFTDVSQYALNIVTLIGLGVSIDYSLFIVNRFRDELARGESRQQAVVTTMATAGRAITFSRLTVAVGLSAMLFFQGTFMASMGAAGAIVVAVAVIYALTFLPAMLAIVGPGVNRLRVPWFGRPTTGTGFWSALAGWVMKRPVLVMVPTVVFLAIAATPFLQIRLAKALESRLDALFAIVRLQAFQRVPDPFDVPLLVLHDLAERRLDFGIKARQRAVERVLPDDPLLKNLGNGENFHDVDRQAGGRQVLVLVRLFQLKGVRAELLDTRCPIPRVHGFVGKVLRHVPLDLPGLHCSRQPPEKQRAADLRGPVKAQDPQFILIHHQSSFVRSRISD